MEDLFMNISRILCDVPRSLKVIPLSRKRLCAMVQDVEEKPFPIDYIFLRRAVPPDRVRLFSLLVLLEARGIRPLLDRKLDG